VALIVPFPDKHVGASRQSGRWDSLYLAFSSSTDQYMGALTIP